MGAPNRTRSKWITRLALVGGLAALVALAPRALKKPPVAVETVRVEKATVRDEVSSSTAGEVMPERHATVRAELGARVMAVKHRRGDRVARGDVIVALDAADLDARIAQAQATVEAQAAQVAQAEAHTQAAARSAERSKALFDKGAGTSQMAEDTAAALREAREAVNAARGLHAQSLAALRVARVARSKAELTAPFAGQLVEVNPDPGEELAPGTPVFEIIDDSKLHVEASIDEADVGRVRVGQPATLKLDGMPNQPIAGVLSKVGPTVRKDLKGARTMPIEVDVVDVPGATKAGLRSGMSANVEIRVAEKADVVSLPTNVIVGRGTRRTVFRVEDGRARVREVQVGLSNWDRSEILGGVSVGDQIVATLNAKQLEDGAPVAVGARR
ncbi:MAG TPA: efflux RND transporter periplasmic adaptor subunit [Polyangia bacterium]|nr:efflux RND transporter periplasmic adaptor subunit [Polyangia bacterium]